MAKKAAVEQEDVIETQEETQEQPDKRASLSSKTAIVLNIAFNVNKPETLKKGTRLAVNSAEYHLVASSFPEGLTRLSETTYELNKDVVIQRKKALPVGTVLDPVKDKWIIDRIKSKHADDAGALKEIPIVEK